MAFWSIGHILNKIFDSATSALGVKVTGSISAQTEGSSVTGKTPEIIAGKTAAGNAQIPLVDNWIDDGSSSEKGLLTYSRLIGYDGTNFDAIRSVNTGQLVVTWKDSTGNQPNIQNVNADGMTPGNSISALSAGMGYIGGGVWDRIRVANVFKAAAATALAAGTAATVWAPAAGKKPRLMSLLLSVSVAGNWKVRYGAAGAGAVLLDFNFAGAGMQFLDLGQGYLAPVINDVIEVYNNTGGVGNVWLDVWGTEE